MSVKIGTTDITKAYIGTTLATKLYVGTTQVWPVGGLAFPVIASTSTEVGTNVGTNNPIPAPTGVTAGDLLLAFVTMDFNSGITASTGWTLHTRDSLSGHELNMFTRIADGGANDALAITGTTADYCASILRITGHGVTTPSTDIKTATANTGSNTAIDPPNLDAGSSRKWLWLAVGALDQNNANQIITAPTNYTIAHAILSSAVSSSSSGMSVTYRTLETQTQNPGTFSNAARPWVAFTVAVPPA